MLLCRLLAPDWLCEEKPECTPREGIFTPEQLKHYNELGYNVFYLPNFPSKYKGGNTTGDEVDTFHWCYVDMDLKEGAYASKEAFIKHVLSRFPLAPSRIVDSGNGIHVYWRITDLEARSFVRLERRLARLLKTDIAVGKIHQLMRLPGYFNTKVEGQYKMCEELETNDNSYTMEQLDAVLPQLTMEDEIYAKDHYDKTYNLNPVTAISSMLPEKFKKLLRESKEVKEIWSGNMDDRSRSDYRLGHLLWSHGFSREEAASVLMNCQKALERAPKHRQAYAEDIVRKIKEFDEVQAPIAEDLSESVEDILRNAGGEIKGTRIPCHPAVDNTVNGFRLGQVIGLVAGSGVGKTAFALNLFRWIVQRNPEYVHFFIPLEQPAREIAERWATMCREDRRLHSKVQIISNYSADGSYRRLSLSDIEEYIINYQLRTGKKAGVVVIDHIAVLRKGGANNESQSLMDICHNMKAFAIRTNTLLIMQSQTPREKAGIGDLELNKDAAYGTTFFEAYCDFLVTLWQPVKRCYSNPGCPTVMAYKFCKIRHKKRGKDVIQEDVPYYMFFDPDDECLREMTQDEEVGFKIWDEKARKERGKDRKTDQVVYTKISWGNDGAKTESNQDEQGSGTVTQVSKR